jgi:ferredoxin
MSHVVTEDCVKCKYTKCASLCPVTAFHEANEFLVINPTECIDCGLCVHACPVHAIYPIEDLPSQYDECVQRNAQLSNVLPVIYATHAPLSDAAKWNGVPNKRQLIDVTFAATDNHSLS